MSLPKGFLEGRTAIVTGASGPIGGQIARALADAGMNLVLTARDENRLQKTTNEIIDQTGVKVATVVADLTDDASRREIIACAQNELGGVDVLVNNAGAEGFGHFHEMPIETIQSMVDVNLTATLLLTRAVLPVMLERNWGHILNASATGGKYGPPYMASYSATKAALITLTQSLRLEYRGRGIGASVLCPGFVEGGGLYERLRKQIKRDAPRVIGGTELEKLGRAAIRAIRHDQPEVLINTPPVRPFLAMTAMFPRLGEWLVRKFAGHFYRRIGRANRQRGTGTNRSKEAA